MSRLPRLAVLAALCCCACCDNSLDSVFNEETLNATLQVPADRYFIDKIFNKYGDKGIISYEGFEHLLDSLGLGGGVFAAPHDVALHRVNGSFQQLHDSQHKHRRKRAAITTEDKVEPILQQKACLSPQDLLDLFGLEKEPGVTFIKPQTFLELCPALVYQLDQRSCYIMKEALPPKVERKWAWIYASISILIISACGLLGVGMVPLLKSAAFEQVLHVLVAVAVGTLCGDALLHLLPHAFQRQDSEHEVVYKCTVIFCTILLFYTVEAVMQTYHGGHSHDHGHTSNDAKLSNDSVLCVDGRNLELNAIMPGSPPPPIEKPMTSTALMVILGDGLHNVTDGLAIGAAFSSDPVTGFATALAVFCHELPHELGDFAVLLRSGMSIRRAMYYNVLSSILSYIGMAVGLWLAEDHESASQWIYAATAGTFLYIALADLVPEINENGAGKVINLILAIFGILLGGIIMLAIALNESSLESLFKRLDK